MKLNVLVVLNEDHVWCTKIQIFRLRNINIIYAVWK